MSSSDPYRRIARVYDRLIEPLQAGVRRVAFGLLPPEPGWKVLDVGCGTGTGMEPYVEAGCAVAGVDTSPAMLTKARDRLGEQAELHLTRGEKLPFEDGRFDLVTTTMVLHEIAAEARAPFVTEMARVARPEGGMLIVDFHFDSFRGWKGPVFRALSDVIERLSGHYSSFRDFKSAGGVPGVVGEAGLAIERDKVIAGGNVAVYVVAPLAVEGNG